MPGKGVSRWVVLLFGAMVVGSTSLAAGYYWGVQAGAQRSLNTIEELVLAELEKVGCKPGAKR